MGSGLGEMAAAYKEAHPDRKSRAVIPWTIEMEKHCMKSVDGAETAAVVADDLARFHRLRAAGTLVYQTGR